MHQNADAYLLNKIKIKLLNIVIFTHLKGLSQAKIVKKSVILFWLLNMTI